MSRKQECISKELSSNRNISFFEDTIFKKKMDEQKYITYFSFDSLRFGKSHLIAFIFSVNKERCLCAENFLCERGTECEGRGDGFERVVKSKFVVAAHNKNRTSLFTAFKTPVRLASKFLKLALLLL